VGRLLEASHWVQRSDLYARITLLSGYCERADIWSLVKSFPSLTDAERFMAGDNTAGAGTENKFYAVKSGRNPGIYTDWTSAQEQIKGWTKPKHRLFQTRAEAQQFLDEDDGRASRAPEPTEADTGVVADDFGGDQSAGATEKPPPAKRAKKTINGASKATKPAPVEHNEADYEAGTAPLPADAEDGFDPNIILDAEAGQVVYKTLEQRQATKAISTGTAQTGPVRIHTDGSSLGNGKEGAFAGVGVYFGPSDPRYPISPAQVPPHLTTDPAPETSPKPYPAHAKPTNAPNSPPSRAPWTSSP